MRLRKKSRMLLFHGKLMRDSILRIIKSRSKYCLQLPISHTERLIGALRLRPQRQGPIRRPKRDRLPRTKTRRWVSKGWLGARKVC